MKLADILSHLYHGSSEGQLKILKPNRSKLAKKPVLFAATFPEIAVAMSGHWDDSDFEFGRTLSGDDDPLTVPYEMRELRKGAFKEFFEMTPVFIYTLKDRSFHQEDYLQDFERVSFNPVVPISVEEVRSPLRYLSRSRMVKTIPYQG